MARLTLSVRWREVGFAPVVVFRGRVAEECFMRGGGRAIGLRRMRRAGFAG